MLARVSLTSLNDRLLVRTMVPSGTWLKPRRGKSGSVRNCQAVQRSSALECASRGRTKREITNGGRLLAGASSTDCGFLSSGCRAAKQIRLVNFRIGSHRFGRASRVRYDVGRVKQRMQTGLPWLVIFGFGTAVFLMGKAFQKAERAQREQRKKNRGQVRAIWIDDDAPSSIVKAQHSFIQSEPEPLRNYETGQGKG